MKENVGTLDLIRVRELLGSLLEGAGLDAYLYEVEPRGGRWGVTIECPVDEGWERIELELSDDRLVSAGGDPKVLAQLRDELSRRVGECKRRD